MKNLLGRIGLIAIFVIFSAFILPTNFSLAEDDLEVDGLNVMPELTEDELSQVNKDIQTVGSSGGQMWDNYNEIASQRPTSHKFVSGIMDWDTIVNYLSFIVEFLSQLGLAVGVIFIIYAGYLYMLNVFNSKTTGSSPVVNAIIGVLIVIFSYAIMRILTSFIGLQ